MKGFFNTLVVVLVVEGEWSSYPSVFTCSVVKITFASALCMVTTKETDLLLVSSLF